MDQPIDSAAYEALHAMATTGVQAPTWTDDGRATMAPQYAPGGQHGYGFNHEEVSQAAWHELDQEKLLWVPDHAVAHLNDAAVPAALRHAWSTRDQGAGARYLAELRCLGPGGGSAQVGPMGGDSRSLSGADSAPATDYAARARTRVGALCDRYHREVALAHAGGAHGTHGKLHAMARLCRALEMGHFFVDGNQRTTAFLLLNKLLMQNGLSPCILPHPTAFDSYSSAHELVGQIREGQRIFNKLCRTGKPALA